MRRPAISAQTVREPLLRRTSGRVVAGVGLGLARHLGWDPMIVRIGFVGLSFAGGAGVLLYALLWIFVQQESPEQAAKDKALRAGAAPGGPIRRQRMQAVALLVLAVGLAWTLAAGGILPPPQFLIPGLMVLGGAVLIWQQADDQQRARWLARSASGIPAESGRRLKSRAWLAAGIGLIVGGVVLLLAASQTLSEVGTAAGATVVILAAVLVLTAPWWRRLVSDLALERRERIRSEERAEVAAHLHDSVLQTLALIQRNVESPREVTRLARGQERELRIWLYGQPDDAGIRFAAAMEQVAGEVEDDYSVTVEAVVVGDAELSEGLRALVQASRECLVNAAKHAGVDEMSLYAEVEPKQVAVFVRDRGRGFDPDDIGEDRRGLRDSVRGRMERYGGAVVVRTKPGAGTEVELTMPVKAGAAGEDSEAGSGK